MYGNVYSPNAYKLYMMATWLRPPTDDGPAYPGSQEPFPRPGRGLVCRLHQVDATLHYGSPGHDQPRPLHRYRDSSSESRVQGIVGSEGR